MARAILRRRMSDVRQPTPGDPVYLAVGRFVVEYSQFIEHMQSGMVVAAGIGRGMPVLSALTIATTPLTDDDLRKVFFAACSVIGELRDDEIAIRDNLNKRAQKLIEIRNRLLHSRWFLASKTGDDPVTWDSPLGDNARVTHNAEGGISRDRSAEVPVPELEGYADEAATIAGLVWEFATGCQASYLPKWPRVGGRLAIDNGTVVRRVPIEAPGEDDEAGAPET